MDNLTVFGSADEKTLEQMKTCMTVDDECKAVLCADNHLGYSQPIGSAIAYRNHISISGVGYDIGCGNKAVATNLHLEDIDVSRAMDEIVNRISFGIGRKNPKPVGHEVLHKIEHAEFAPQRKLLKMASDQLGTVGAGNHYVDLFTDYTKRIWVGVHFGSRGFGHKTASGFLSLAAGGSFDERGHEGEMMSPPVLLRADSALAKDYIAAMNLAGAYASAGRDIVCHEVLDIMGAKPVLEVHNHHNFCWFEEHPDGAWWVMRKGCTPNHIRSTSFVGATMGEPSAIVTGTDTSGNAMYSTVHGAGRAMSRTEAAGKRRKRWTCNDRDCTWIQEPRTPKPDACPACGNEAMRKAWVHEREGKIDFASVQDELRAKGIVLRGGAADEAPAAYKRLDEVLEAQGDTIRVAFWLTPVGVAMAGVDVFDPFKD